MEEPAPPQRLAGPQKAANVGLLLERGPEPAVGFMGTAQMPQPHYKATAKYSFFQLQGISASAEFLGLFSAGFGPPIGIGNGLAAFISIAEPQARARRFCALLISPAP